MATSQSRALVRPLTGSALSARAERALTRAGRDPAAAPLAVALSAGVGLLGLGVLLARRRAAAPATGIVSALRAGYLDRRRGGAPAARGFYAAEVSVVSARVIRLLDGE